MKCSYPKSAHMLCMLCASKHSSKPAYTLQAVYMHPVYMHPPTQACAYSARCVHASIHSSLRILCKLCTCIHTFKPPHTLQAVYMHPHTQASAYSARCVHASTHSSLRILCTLCTCIHPINPAHTLQAVYMHPPTQASAYSASRAHSDLACKPACKSACELCMKSLQVQAETCMRMQSMHAEGAACRVCM